MTNVLAIGAHGDDLELFCGGTLARCAERGDNVFMCVVTDGRGRPQGDPDQIAAIRKAEAQASADVIGAELIWLGIPDGGLMFNEESRHLFIETIRRVKPDLIITHPADDYHPDHKTTSRLVMDAAPDRADCQLSVAVSAASRGRAGRLHGRRARHRLHPGGIRRRDAGLGEKAGDARLPTSASTCPVLTTRIISRPRPKITSFTTMPVC